MLAHKSPFPWGSRPGASWARRLPRFSSRCLNSSPVHPRFKILYLGRDEFSCLVLKELHGAPDVWESITIATNPNERIGRRGTQLTVSPLKLLGESLRLPVHLIPHTKPEFRQWRPPSPFSPSQPPPSDHLVITASFGRILSPVHLSMFAPTRRLNVHPSLLPIYRGPAPIQHTILNGDKETGVCVIQMLKFKEGIDAGPVWGSSRMPVNDGASFTGLRDTLARAGGQSLVSVLRDMQTGKAISTPQSPLGLLPHAPVISVVDSIVDFSTMSAASIVRRHRAISHHKPLVTSLSTEKTLQLHSPSIFTEPVINLTQTPGTASYHKPTQAMIISCSDNSVLSVPLLKQEGKSLMKAKDWWNGAKGLGLVHNGEVRFTAEFAHRILSGQC
ncbi:formyl transferase [Collybia nuda]|uniref:methionyl-tRNA formyltransferase n=1 Tax=Collybia nuda TaxID=64659 RepID=A0A9P5YH77_9AGAR|nr:formyl transferase [Collybia nuda]